MPNTETGFAEVKSTRFYYEMAGEGFPLILMHAGICDSRMWDEQFNLFADHYRTVRYDLRGYGQTQPVEGTHAHHEDLQALMQNWDIEQAYLIACSMSGAVAIDFTLAYPQAVAGLVVVGTAINGFAFDDTRPPQLDAMIQADEAGDMERLAELEVEVWVDGPQRTPDAVNPAIRNLVRQMNTIALQNEALELGILRELEPPAATRLHDITTPTLAIVGDLDRPRILAGTDKVVQDAANAHKIIMQGTAHLPNMERPDEFNAHVLSFLEGLRD